MHALHCACEREADQTDPSVQREIAAAANRIDALIAAFAFGVILGWWIA